MKKLCVRLGPLTLLLAAACVGSSKSANPLSPVIAGPIPGVGISAPTVVAPPIDARLNTTTQPITFQVANAETTGVRPLTYRFEIATDPGFSNQVYAKDGIPQDPSGRTSLTLPGPLTSERKYYWHARAEDGANTGPFGATSAFNIFTAVVFGPPTLISPVGGETTATSQPRFVIGNATHTGPAGQIVYLLELSSSSNFSPLAASYQFYQTPTRTELTAPTSLAAGQYFWRARAFDGAYTGPFSGAQAFTSPGGIISGGGSPGKPCGPPYPTTAIGILQCRRSQYPTNMSVADHVAFLRGSARDFNAAGIASGPFGILVKTTGSNCNGYSCDILCAGNGPAQKQWDVLVGVPGTPVNFAAVDTPAIRVCEIQ
jgi:hypothetical protein